MRALVHLIFLAQFNLDDGGEVKMEKKNSFFLSLWD